MVTDVHVTTLGEGTPVVFVHGILSWGTDIAFGFGGQLALADRYRLLLMDRRGYGGSPDIEHSDYRVDAGDVADLLGDGAHLVGHSYGGVAAMLAAARRPAAVRSLTLIQPGCLQAAADDPAVAAALAAAREGLAKSPPEMSAETFLKLTLDGVGLPALSATPERLRAAATTMRERPCWEGELPIRPLAEAAWPKLVIAGDWADSPTRYREKVGVPLMITARITAERIGARLLVVPGYYPQVEHPERVNRELTVFWNSADQT